MYVPHAPPSIESIEQTGKGAPVLLDFYRDSTACVWMSLRQKMQTSSCIVCLLLVVVVVVVSIRFSIVMGSTIYLNKKKNKNTKNNNNLQVRLRSTQSQWRVVVMMIK